MRRRGRSSKITAKVPKVQSQRRVFMVYDKRLRLTHAYQDELSSLGNLLFPNPLIGTIMVPKF
jgi:hypothetical protein